MHVPGLTPLKNTGIWKHDKWKSESSLLVLKFFKTICKRIKTKKKWRKKSFKIKLDNNTVDVFLF